MTVGAIGNDLGELHAPNQLLCIGVIGVAKMRCGVVIHSERPLRLGHDGRPEVRALYHTLHV